MINAQGLFLSMQLEKIDEWHEWMEKIPFIKFPSEWLVKAIPPLSGAIIRYMIKTTLCDRVSIYLDGYDRLGYFGEPYWEVYPFEGDVFRCRMNDIESLLDAISKAEDK